MVMSQTPTALDVKLLKQDKLQGFGLLEDWGPCAAHRDGETVSEAFYIPIHTAQGTLASDQ